MDQRKKKIPCCCLHSRDLSIACPVSIWFATQKNGDDKIKNIKYVKKNCDSNFRQSHIPGSKRKRVFHALNAFKEHLAYFFKCNFAIYHKKTICGRTRIWN